VRLKIVLIRVLYWKRELSKFRSGERKQLNRAKKTNTLGDWARCEEAQRIYKEAIVVAKRVVGKQSVKALRVLQRDSAFTEFLTKKPASS
jgi:hypothetical protein